MAISGASAKWLESKIAASVQQIYDYILFDLWQPTRQSASSLVMGLVVALERPSLCVDSWMLQRTNDLLDP